MCGRAYSTITVDEMEAKYWTERRKRKPLPDFAPNFNLCPTQETVVIRQDESERSGDLLKWGLVPFWAKDVKLGFKMINARAETVAEKPAFRNALTQRRCIVPLSGFYEWRAGATGKRPFAIYSKQGEILSAAGLWEENTAVGNAPLRTFTIITTGANTFMNDIHDRMPVFLDDRHVDAWLDPALREPAKIVKLLKPAPDAWFKAHEVSTAVNSPKNNRPELLAPTGEVLGG